jgi:hypothetical protein
MNEHAGNGAPLILQLRLENGEQLPFAVDTGCFLSIIDASLTNRLGRHRGKAVGGGQIGHPPEDMEIYAAPKLFLGDTQLTTSRWIQVKSTEHLSPNNRVQGVLGMDCLKNYCIQLDFDSRRIQFLDPDHLDEQELGKAFPLVMKKCPLGGELSYVDADLFGRQGVRFWIDTGFFGEGDFWLKSKVYGQVLRDHAPNRTGKHTSFEPLQLGIANLAHAEFATESYADLKIGEMPDHLIDVPAWMSLQFLARHRVTFNFPKRVMYLRQRDCCKTIE